jgi:hypothetical protein
MNGTRDPQAIIATWLEEGPLELPPDTRQAIVVGVRAVAQRRSRFPWLRRGALPGRQNNVLRHGLALGAVALAAVVGFGAWSQLNNLLPLGPSPSPSPMHSPSPPGPSPPGSPNPSPSVSPSPIAGPAPPGEPQAGAIAYTSGGRIVLVDPATGHQRDLTPPLRDLVDERLSGSCGQPGGGLTASDMTWSPDGRALAFVPYSEVSRLRCGVFVASSDGETVHMLLDAETHQIVNWMGHAVLGWAPDGSQVAIGHEGSVVLASIDGSDSVDLGSLCRECVVERFAKAGWAPDGTMVAARIIVGNSHHPYAVAVVQTATGTWTKLWPPEGVEGGEEPHLQAWLPNGSLLIQAGGAFFAVDPADPQQPGRLDMDDTPDPRFQVWSPDQDRVAWNAGDEGLMVRHVATGDTTQFADWSAYGQPAWSPDGSELGLIRESDWSVWVVGADGSDARHVAQGDAGSSLTWQPVWP